MITNLNSWCFYIASFGGLGEKLGGSFFAGMIAIPVLFLLRALYWLNPTIFFVFLSIAALASIIITYFALHFISDKDPSIIVLDKFWSVLLAFAAIQPGFKVIIVGFLLLHLCRFIIPIICYRFWNINFYEYPLRMTSALFSSLIFNIFLRFILWIGA